MTRFAMTGPRVTTPPMTAIIRTVVAGLSDVAEFSQGAQYGADTDAWRAALDEHPEAASRAVVPVGMPHNEKMVAMIEQWVRLDGEWDGRRRLRVPAEVVRVEPGDRSPGAWLYHARNARLLDFADVLVAFPRTAEEERVGSGTWACVREAQRRGIPVWFFPLDGSPSWSEGLAFADPAAP